MLKPQQTRLVECLHIRRQLRDLGIPFETEDEYQDLRTAMDRFVKYGEGSSGRVRIQSLGRTAIYQLATRLGRDSHIVLKNDEN
jgi:hypothetical protein